MNRKKILLKNVSLGLIYKAFNMLIVFTTIPLLLNYLDKELYGIWVTIFSLINIVLFVDGGIGNGLKTKLTEALSLRNIELAKSYISTAYISITAIAGVLFIIVSIFVYFTDLQNLFNTNSLSNIELKILLFTTLILVLLGFILNLYKSFYYANQQAAQVEFSVMIYQLLVLILILFLIKFYSKNLLFIVIIYGGLNVLIGIVFTLFFFKNNKHIIPSIKAFNREKVSSLMGLSLVFFVIQLCMIVIFTTDNLIITQLIGPEEVAIYDIVYKLFYVFITLSVISQDSLWALYTDAFQKKDFSWIKKTLWKLNFLFLIFVVFIILLFFWAKPIIKLWTQKELLISNSLVFLMGLFVITRVYGIIYMNFLNSVGRIKLQMWLFIFGSIINIPLSIYFVKNTNLGSSGVILGTILSIMSLSIVLPFQTFNILKKNKL